MEAQACWCFLRRQRFSVRGPLFLSYVGIWQEIDCIFAPRVWSLPASVDPWNVMATTHRSAFPLTCTHRPIFGHVRNTNCQTSFFKHVGHACVLNLVVNCGRLDLNYVLLILAHFESHMTTSCRFLFKETVAGLLLYIAVWFRFMFTLLLMYMHIKMWKFGLIILVIMLNELSWDITDHCVLIMPHSVQDTVLFNLHFL